LWRGEEGGGGKWRGGRGVHGIDHMTPLLQHSHMLHNKATTTCTLQAHTGFHLGGGACPHTPPPPAHLRTLLPPPPPNLHCHIIICLLFDCLQFCPPQSHASTATIYPPCSSDNFFISPTVGKP